MLCYLYKQEPGANTEKFRLFNDNFEIIINSKQDKEMLEDFDPTVDIRHVKAGYFTPTEISWPILSSDNFSSTRILYMLIHI